MSKKSRVKTSIRFYDGGKEVELYDTLFLKDGSIVVQEVDEEHKHHHLYYDNKGKFCCHSKDERTNKRTSSNETLCDIKAKIIKKRGL